MRVRVAGAKRARKIRDLIYLKTIEEDDEAVSGPGITGEEGSFSPAATISTYEGPGICPLQSVFIGLLCLWDMRAVVERLKT